MDHSPIDQDFRSFIQRPQMEWDLAEGAFLIALQEYPGFRLADGMAAVGELAREFLARPLNSLSPREKLNQLNDFFFQEKGFYGNLGDYYNPRNSYLPDVLERKTGIPITLSALYLWLAWQARWPIFGINFPGHFLAAWKEGAKSEPLYLDVFGGGKILDEAGIRELWDKRNASTQGFEPAIHLRNAGIPDILHRILSNLKSLHFSQGRLERALWAAEWMLWLKPTDWETVRDRGFFYFSLGLLEEAEKSLELYLEKTGKPRDFAQVWNLIYAIRAQKPANFN